MWIEILLLLLALCLYIYHTVTKQFDFFIDRGIPHEKPSFPFGSKATTKMCSGEIPVTDLDTVTMKEGGFEKEKVVGYFNFGQPTYIVNDDEIAKHILIKDFEFFTDRRSGKTADKYANAFMTNLTGTEWKQVRSLMSGVFTSGKLKMMTEHIVKAGQNLEKYIEEIADKDTEVDMKVVGGQMTLDAIATATFGLETDSFKQPENKFRIMALTLAGAPGYVSKFFMAKIMLMLLLPKVARALKINFMDQTAVKFFVDILTKTYKNRIQTGERRNDMIDIVIDELKASKSKAKKETEFESEDTAFDTSNLNNPDMDDETLLISNALLFFFAGFDTSSQAITLCCYKLVKYPDIQAKVAEEIDAVLDDGPITYAKLQDLKYMDMFILESLRNRSMFESHERKCTKDYKIPGTDYIIPKGRYVHVYIDNIINSEKNFINPGDFDPENFNPENKPNKFGNQGFGHGPRNCIGMRYALLVVKICLVSLLRRYRMVRGQELPEVMVLDAVNPQVFKEPVCVKFEKRA